MKHLARLALASVAALGALGTGAWAQVTPTHTFETPMVFNPFTGNLIFASMIGPPPGENVWGTDIHLEWTTTSTQPASEFHLHLSTFFLASGPSAPWELTGAGLGWGGSGTFRAIASTDLFNDTLVPSFLPGSSTTFDLQIDAASGGGLWGVLGPQSKIVFHLGPRVDGDVPSVSLSAGGTQTLALNAGPTVGPGMSYLVAGTSSGTQPGVVLGGMLVPLQYDAYTRYSVASANQGPFVNTFGTLDGTGQATAQIAVPAGSSPSLAGVVLHHSMIGLDFTAGAVVAASNPVALTLNP
jgi:hypothetical protein